MNLQNWTLRETPLPIHGCWAKGSAGSELRRKLLERSGSGLRAVEVEGHVVALGEEPPWVDSAVFITRVGELYLPALWEPSVPVSWIASRLRTLGQAPWLLLPSEPVIGLSQAAVIS